jgi:hypothetical protein
MNHVLNMLKMAMGLDGWNG